jgi:hypothetical protein
VVDAMAATKKRAFVLCSAKIPSDPESRPVTRSCLPYEERETEDETRAKTAKNQQVHTRDRGHQEDGAPAQSRTWGPRFRKPAWDDFPKDLAKNARPLRDLYELAARIARTLSRFVV